MLSNQLTTTTYITTKSMFIIDCFSIVK